MALDDDFIAQQEVHLLARLREVSDALSAGGEKALLCSESDLTLLKLALHRLKTLQYGLCVSCGLPIGAERLQEIPETPRCLSCQNDLDSVRTDVM